MKKRFVLLLASVCSVNWHKKELKLWVVQNAGGGQPWNPTVAKAAEMNELY